MSSLVWLGVGQVQGLRCQNSHNKLQTERGIFFSLALRTLLLHQHLAQLHKVTFEQQEPVDIYDRVEVDEQSVPRDSINIPRA